MPFFLTPIDLVIILTIYLVAHYLVFSRRNSSLSERAINEFRRFFLRNGWLPSNVVKVKGLHRFSLEKLPKLISKAIVFTTLLPREMPINWVLSRINGKRDVVTFEANLFKKPVLQLEILDGGSSRWRRVISRAPSEWVVREFKGGNLYVSVWRPNSFRYWVRKLYELVSSVDGLDCVERISVRWTPPHIIATFYMDEIDDASLEKAFNFILELLNIVTSYRVKGRKK